MFRLNRKGQNTLEYVLLITAVVVAFLLIQYYLNRGLQGRQREAADNIGDQFDGQDTTSNFTMTSQSTVRDTNFPSLAPGGGNIIRSELIADEVNTRSGQESVQAPAW